MGRLKVHASTFENNIPESVNYCNHLLIYMYSNLQIYLYISLKNGIISNINYNKPFIT